jgi:surface antigen
MTPKPCLAILVAGALAAPAAQAQGDDLSRMLTEENIGRAVGAAAGALLGSQIGGGRGKLAAVAIGTLAGYWLGGEIGRALSQRDRAGIAATTQEALETGETRTWENPDTGVYTKVSVAEAGDVPREGRPPMGRVPALTPVNAWYAPESTINVRGGPGTDYMVLHQIPGGERVPVIGKVVGRDWYMIAEGGTGSGFLYAPLMTPVSGAYAPEGAVRAALDEGGLPQRWAVARDECRRINQEVVLPDGRRQDHAFTACRQPDGSWAEV